MINKLKEIIGLSVEEAKKKLKVDYIRIVSKDGNHFFSTSDFVSDRINVDLENNIIIDAHFG